jgi:hypothetical protein
MTVTATGAAIRVRPSGLAWRSASAAICPAAPGRFSTITAAPRLSFIFSAASRAIRSALPPGGKPTRIR